MSINSEVYCLQPPHEEIASHILRGIEGRVNTIAIIGSYTIARVMRPGSDIDLIVAVDDIEKTTVDFDDVVYKKVDISDSMGKRKEVNTILAQTVLDVTVIDRFARPNNPLTDNYENAVGSCYGSITIYGSPLKELFKLDDAIKSYEEIRHSRKTIVEDKIETTKQKIVDQGRNDLHILYELQKYVFVRECITRNIFNRLSIKHPLESIPDFDNVFEAELRECGLILSIDKAGKI